MKSKEDSYTERRKLFKNIWETAMNMEDKNTDIINKPKVVKTLRLDEVDRINIGKTKKQRIKSLRHVCNRILEFCNRQEADDAFYEQLMFESPTTTQQKAAEASKRTKTARPKKKIRKAKSYAPVGDKTQAKPTTSEGREEGLSTHKDTGVSKILPPQRIKRTTIVKKINPGSRNLNPKPSPVKNPAYDVPKLYMNKPVSRRKVIKKKHKKKTINHTSTATRYY